MLTARPRLSFRGGFGHAGFFTVDEFSHRSKSFIEPSFAVLVISDGGIEPLMCDLIHERFIEMVKPVFLIHIIRGYFILCRLLRNVAVLIESDPYIDPVDRLLCITQILAGHEQKVADIGRLEITRTVIVLLFAAGGACLVSHGNFKMHVVI